MYTRFPGHTYSLNFKNKPFSEFEPELTFNLNSDGDSNDNNSGNGHDNDDDFEWMKVKGQNSI